MDLPTDNHSKILNSLRILAAEVSTLKRAGLEIDDGQFLAVLDLIDSGLAQVLKKLPPTQTPPND
jgi:hypothetical protein